jgi:hypothetical protein
LINYFFVLPKNGKISHDSYEIHKNHSRLINCTKNKTCKIIILKNMLGQAVERKPKVEQVNQQGGRLLREAKVR